MIKTIAGALNAIRRAKTHDELQVIRYPRLPPDVYCTSYCNHGHCMHTGKPVRHACYILPPRALELERDGHIEAAIDVIAAAKPLRPHSGVRHP